MSSKNHKRRASPSRPRAVTQPAEALGNAGPANFTWLVTAGVLILAASIWAYWPTWVLLVSAWNREPDYSHGYFVIPLALYFLWARRHMLPGWRPQFGWPGLVLIIASIALRYAGARYYVDAIDAWSLVLWTAGVVWLIGGWRIVRWSWPSIVFLLFMIPLPWRAERLVSHPLQRVATKLSTWMLQCCGQSAIAEGNTIWLSNTRLEVEQACSGLRIFVAIVALAFVYLVLVRRSWWQRLLLVAGILPIALVANATRIVATGLLGQYVSDEAAHKFTHDLSGWIMIPYAAALFALLLSYMGRLVREVEVIDVGTIIRQVGD